MWLHNKGCKVRDEQNYYFQDVCIGPIIKYAVFDAFFGVVCSLLLIFGAHLRNNCLLISWVVITLCTSLKYFYVVVISDWSRLEVITSLTSIVLSTRHNWGLELDNS